MTELQAFYNKTPTTKEDKLTHYIIRFCNGFEGSPANETVRKPTNPYIRTQNIKEHKQRLNHIKVLSQEYTTTIKNYDSKDT